MEPLLFTNFSSEPFVGVYNKKEYKFKPGQSMYLEDHLVAHFGKHLSDREMRKIGKRIVDEPFKSEMVKKVNPALKWKQGKHQVIVDEDIVKEMQEQEEDEFKDMDSKTKLINKQKKKSSKADNLAKARAAKAAKKAEKEFAELEE